MGCRDCHESEQEEILAIVNAAAVAYRGVIPDDRWHEPYMDSSELESEVAAGVRFRCYEVDREPVGVMGFQRLEDVDLIRHAYVRPDMQRRGVGAALLEDLLKGTNRRTLVGTWAAADGAIAFYRRHGFELVSPERTIKLLQTYWTIPRRQIETSVVLSNPPDDETLGNRDGR